MHGVLNINLVDDRLEGSRYIDGMAQVFIGIAALIHLYIFGMESILWGQPRTNRVFGVTAELAEQNRLFALNQGFYNLFLAIAAFAGIGLYTRGLFIIGLTLMTYAAVSMLGASIVLFFSQRRLIRPALVQGLPPLLGLVFFGLKFFG
jgi:putative membrane protein